MTRLHVFDLDGTLMHGSAAPLEISRQLGADAVNRVVDLERDFLAERITPPDFALRVWELWGELTEAQVAAAFQGAPWLAGIQEVWARIRARGEHSAVISLSPDFFVTRLLDWGVDAAFGSRWPAVPFRSAVDPSGILSAAAKVKITDELCAKLGISRADCVAYGDSLSDGELFAAVPTSVAVNADQRLTALASYVYVGRDLREAYQLIPDGRASERP